MTARFSASEIAAAAREAREHGAVVELHRPDGSKLVVRPQPVQSATDADFIQWGPK